MEVDEVRHTGCVHLSGVEEDVISFCVSREDALAWNVIEGWKTDTEVVCCCIGSGIEQEETAVHQSQGEDGTLD